MLHSLKGFDWKTSKAHWLLLSKFVHPQSPDDFSKADYWESVLGEAPAQSIKRFLSEGLVAVAELENVLTYKYKATELKDMLKQHGLPVSGRKEDMIRRLVTEDPVGMEKSIAGLTVLQCTIRGRELSEKYLLGEREKRSRIETQILEYLRKRMFAEASLAVVTYEAEQVFPRGLGIDWKSYDSTRDIEIMGIIFSSKPKILSNLRDEKLDNLRVGAAMMALWGKNTAHQWLPSEFKTELSLDADTAARMLLFYAIHKTSLEQYRRSEVVKYVEILGTQEFMCRM